MISYGVTGAQCVNSLWPSDTIWRHRSQSTLAQVMACCLLNAKLPPTRMLSLIVDGIFTKKFRWNLNIKYNDFNSRKCISWCYLEICSGVNELKFLSKQTKKCCERLSILLRTIHMCVQMSRQGWYVLHFAFWPCLGFRYGFVNISIITLWYFGCSVGGYFCLPAGSVSLKTWRVEVV